MPRRVVLHAGFHKTGTSTVQTVLRDNRAALKPYLRALLKPGMGDLLPAARGYSTWRDPLTLAKFRRRFEALLRAHTGMPRRTLCLSAEELSGHMPGRGALADYTAAPVLATEMAKALQTILPKTEVMFVFSTRAPDDWLHSAYWEHVKSSSMTLEFGDFAARYARAADLDDIVARVRASQPCPVHSHSLETALTHPGGPAGPVLDLCGVPEAVQSALPRPRANARPAPEVLLALLQANRDYTDRDRRKAAKQAILSASKESRDDG